MATQESLLAAGGKEWKKDTAHRIYVSKESFATFARESGVDVDFVGGLHPAVKRISEKDVDCKAWFNCLTQKFESKKPSIQAYFDTYANK